MIAKNQSSPVHDRGKPNRAESDEGAVCRPSRHRLSNEVFPATHRTVTRRRPCRDDLHAQWLEGTQTTRQSSGTTPSTRAARGGEEESEWCWVQPDHTKPRAARAEACGKRSTRRSVREENTWVSTWTREQLVGNSARAMECHGERLMECHDDRKRTTQALDEPRHHTVKMVCVRRLRGETDALANSDAGELVQLNSPRQPIG